MRSSSTRCAVKFFWQLTLPHPRAAAHAGGIRLHGDIVGPAHGLQLRPVERIRSQAGTSAATAGARLNLIVFNSQQRAMTVSSITTVSSSSSNHLPLGQQFNCVAIQELGIQVDESLVCAEHFGNPHFPERITCAAA